MWQMLVFLVRVPFFCLGVLLYTVVAGGWMAILGCFWIVWLPPAWAFLAVPVVFLYDLLTNDPKHFKEFMSNCPKKWWTAISNSITSFLGVYGDMAKWLVVSG